MDIKVCCGIMDEIDFYIKEDLDDIGDVTSDNLFEEEKGKARITAKEKCMLAGMKESEKIFQRFDAELKQIKKDGDTVSKNETVAEIKGKVRSILTAERLALNVICRMSGIATATNKIVKKALKMNPNVNIAATRKTTPGFRKYEKKAVEIGGGKPHRFGLFDAVIIKDNHIKKAGDITKAIKKIKKKIQNKTIEVEVQNIWEAKQAANVGLDVIMLDNFTPQKAENAYTQIKKINKNIKVEISGGITPENIERYAKYADRISMGYITHSVGSKDFSLNLI
ncbi:MAG: carboxylating nicotinate-nucleotide diphosphorylase [Candidatus Thermoplasmatota archaeon]